jgi:hypothetical protein
VKALALSPRIVNIEHYLLGLETYCEIISIELLKKLDLSGSIIKAPEKLNLFLPRGNSYYKN